MQYIDTLYNWQSKKDRREKGIYEVPDPSDFYVSLATAVSKIHRY